ncbi:acetyl-CoA C-acetyltransferase [Onchocerca flexuosa]|uniref:acetyl-CoA C-acyltransferase n=1 Tax=Onchocerca flexuosa TaxID=387005 RepID=A0A238BXV4_9BILA|nr:acetyl-CoA C-acetyltransferase [Onchocerca flexuosa]
MSRYLSSINPGSICRIRSLYSISCFSNSTASATSTKTFSKSDRPNIILVDAVRTPFLQSRTTFKNMMAIDLQRAALLALVDRTKISMQEIGHIVCGTVIQEHKTSNVAREAALTAGFSKKIPAHTVTLACISSNVAITDIMNMLATDRAKKLSDKLTAVKDIAANFFSPELPAVAEFTTGETMGHSGDRLAAAFGVSRREQDEFAMRSHVLADRAMKENLLSDVIPVFVPGSKPVLVRKDNGIRVSSMEKLAQLKPAFVKFHGTVTPGGSERINCNGQEHDLNIAGTTYSLLHGLIISSYDVDSVGLTLKDVDVFEIHEAFAGQILANLNAMDSDYFCKEMLKRPTKYGRIPEEKLNTWGGSLSIGHPFGATGVRLLSHAANQHLAIVAACAAGGHGIAMLIENYPNIKEGAGTVIFLCELDKLINKRSYVTRSTLFHQEQEIKKSGLLPSLEKLETNYSGNMRRCLCHSSLDLWRDRE